jgi:hypothetical protein
MAAFSGRYFRWALARWEPDLIDDFSALRACEGFSSAALVAIECFQRLAAVERRAMACALVKRAHSDAVALCLLRRWSKRRGTGGS